MPCGTCGGGTPNRPQPVFEVTLPNGTTQTVEGEHAAKVAVTMAGGGTYRKV